jgi:hypothetical protein
MSEVNSITEIEYRPIAGFPGYRVGSDGSVWSSKRSGSTRCNFPWKCKSPGIDTNGYPFVKLYGGEASPQAKLTDDAVRIILSTPQKWGVCAALSRQFGVSAVTILRVRQRKLWTHVT